MKKLLSILGSLSFTTVSISTVVSCSSIEPPLNQEDDNYFENPIDLSDNVDLGEIELKETNLSESEILYIIYYNLYDKLVENKVLDELDPRITTWHSSFEQTSYFDYLLENNYIYSLNYELNKEYTMIVDLNKDYPSVERDGGKLPMGKDLKRDFYGIINVKFKLIYKK